MKILITSISLLFSVLMVQGQNLVPNSSFESVTSCPTTYNQIDKAIGWYPSYQNNFGGYHTELVNSCNTGNFSVPSNTWGYQNAFQGQSYIATGTMAPSIGSDYRENVYCLLTSPLSIGDTFQVSLRVSLADNCIYTTNNLGVKFSTNTYFPIDNISQVYSQNVITEKNSWIEINGSFVADSAYQYMAVGNFFTDANTIRTNTYPSAPFIHSAYFIDEISVTQVVNVSIKDQKKVNNVSVSSHITPDGDGLNDEVICHGLPSNLKGSFKLYDSFGRLICVNEIQRVLWKGYDLRGNRVKNGIYFYEISGKEILKTGKIQVF